MGTVSSYEAKTHLSGLLKRVAKGEKITITRHGISVAVMTRPRTSEKKDTAVLIRDMREFRKGHILGGMDLKEMIEKGRNR